jgi:hypothetical protein
MPAMATAAFSGLRLFTGRGGRILREVYYHHPLQAEMSYFFLRKGGKSKTKGTGKLRYKELPATGWHSSVAQPSEEFNIASNSKREPGKNPIKPH